MPAAVQTKSRSNRSKLFKQYYRHSTPHFRCYHGSRLPPRSFEGMWPHKKFYAKDIKTGPHRREKAKVPTVLAAKLKAEPKKRKRRGILKKTVTGKKKGYVKSLKPRKYVQFGKKKAMGKRREQAAVEAPGFAFQTGRAGVPGGPARTYGTKGDVQQRIFRLNAAGQLVASARPARKIRIV